MRSKYTQRLPMAPKYNVATGREELGRTTTYRRSKRPRRRPKWQTWPKQPNWSRLPPQRGDKGHQCVQNTHKGSPWRPNTMLQQAEKNWAAPQRTGGVNVLEDGQSGKRGPSSQIGAVCPRKEETRDINAFKIHTKAPHGAQIQCCNRQRRIGPHHNVQEE